MSTLPLVSVIVPAYNAERFIGQTLESIIAQTYKHLEILVVDDGSIDRTVPIVQAYMNQDARIQLLQKPNGGVATARNLGIQHAKGAFIAPIDSDDIWWPQNLELQIAKMAEGGERVGLVYSWSVFIKEDGSLMKICQSSEFDEYVHTVMLYRNLPGNASSALMRRSALDAIKDPEQLYFDSTYKANGGQGCEDWDIFMRIAEQYEYRVVPQLLVGYRQVQGSMSSKSNVMLNGYDMLMERTFAKYPTMPKKMYHWSRGNFLSHLAISNYRLGHYGHYLRYFWQAMTYDWIFILRPILLLMVVMSAMQIIFQPLAVLIWPDHEAWIKFKTTIVESQWNPRYHVITLEQLQTRSEKQKHTFPWKQFEQILRYRCQLVDQERQAVQSKAQSDSAQKKTASITTYA